MLKFLRKIDLFLDRHVPILLSLALLLFLRLPNLVEPYWYGDEAIYLTIGDAMRHGEKLYSQIIDHKTPVIYYLAMVPNQFWFRVELLIAMFLSTLAFHRLSQKIFGTKWVAFIATILFVVGTSLPSLEGNIPNGELFVMFFILMGATLLSKSHFFSDFFSELPHPKLISLAARKYEKIWLFSAGCLFGLGVLTKIPGLFDVLGFLSIGWFSLLATLPITKIKRKLNWLKDAKKAIFDTLIIGLGILAPIISSIIYYVIRGSGQAYLDYGLLYNFHYADSWKLNLANSILAFSFSFLGKTIFCAVVLLFLSFISRFIRRDFQFIASWCALATFATLLSNRPYQHYLLQLVPPFSLLIAKLLATATEIHFHKKVKKAEAADVTQLVKLKFKLLNELIISGFLIWTLLTIISVLNLKPYPTFSYYDRFFKLLENKISATAYRDSFEPLMADNYAASAIISQSPGAKLFIWGTDPGIYALAKKIPVGRFTVLFHITDFHAEHETYLDFIQSKPTYAVIQKGETPTPEILSYLQANYIPNFNFNHFILWKKLLN